MAIGASRQRRISLPQEFAGNLRDLGELSSAG
jgi:hypothetical protein